MITLRGMTWNHPRGIDPLVAHARAFETQHGVRIEWDARSLEDFEAFPLDELAAKYDLMVIDHPHVGMAAASGCLLPLDTVGRDAELASLNGNTVGRSQESYHLAGHQWALAIDAATQVAARRAGAMADWPRTFDEVIELAKSGRVLCALVPVHAMMCFFSLSANAGQPCRLEGDVLIENDAGIATLERLGRLAALVPPKCFELNPIGVFEAMIDEPGHVYTPLVYGYVSYARAGFRKTRIEFGDIAGVAGSAAGSTLGGTGVAVSRATRHPSEAVEVAFDLASTRVQRGQYAAAGGQPAHRLAWTDAEVNRSAPSFFLSTIETLDSSYIRPRYDGYIAFQSSAGLVVQQAIRHQHDYGKAIEQINHLFRQSQKR